MHVPSTSSNKQWNGEEPSETEHFKRLEDTVLATRGSKNITPKISILSNTQNELSSIGLSRIVQFGKNINIDYSTCILDNKIL